MKKIFVPGFTLLLGLCASAQASDAIPNWAAPSSWTPPSARAAGRSALVTYPPLPFVPITPCRIIDTRVSQAFPDPWGPPSLLGSEGERTFPIADPRCGIPLDAKAVSFNMTVFNPAALGNLRFFPAGDVLPTVSTINWPAGIRSLANAAIVPLGPSGLGGDGITVHASTLGALDLIVDVNGFYGATPADPNQFFSLNTNSSSYTMSLKNTSTTCKGACGILQVVGTGFAIEGDTSSIDPKDQDDAGVLGQGFVGVGVKGLSNTNFGVQGQALPTPDNAGVMGTDAGTSPVTLMATGLLSAGVRGEGQHGVIGISSTVGAFGVLGIAVAPSTIAVQANGDTGATGVKNFIEPHPTDPSLTIRYVALEGPEAGTYFRGTATTVNREAIIEVPESFRIVTAEEGLTVQLTPVGALAQMAVMTQDLNRIFVRSSRDVAFHYHVNGVRRAFRDWQVIAEDHQFRPVSPDQKMPAWLTEEAKRRLVANGTYNPDGTVNVRTAERLGWAQKWREDEAKAKAAAEASTIKLRQRRTPGD